MYIQFWSSTHQDWSSACAVDFRFGINYGLGLDRALMTCNRDAAAFRSMDWTYEKAPKRDRSEIAVCHINSTNNCFKYPFRMTLYAHNVHARCVDLICFTILLPHARRLTDRTIIPANRGRKMRWLRPIVRLSPSNDFPRARGRTPFHVPLLKVFSSIHSAVFNLSSFFVFSSYIGFGVLCDVARVWCFNQGKASAAPRAMEDESVFTARQSR